MIEIHKPIRVISRYSALAIKQVEEVFEQLPHLSYDLTICKSFGDKHKHISLMKENLRSDFFTKELDDAILLNQADIAIHSAKDLPYPLPEGLEVIALTKKLDGSDSLVVRAGIPTSLSELPQGAVIGTSSLKRKQELLALREDLFIKCIRGTIEERIQQADEGVYDAVIIATCALLRLGLHDRIAERLTFATHPLQGVLAIVANRQRTDLKELFSFIDDSKHWGRVSLVGFGPGNPDLLTLRAVQRMEEADVLFYDALLDQNFLKEYSAELVYVGKRKDYHSKEQTDINSLLLIAALQGKKVVRLKGGDPMIFAHGGEEVEFLQSNLIEVEVVPGISTANAVASLCKIPLTHRDIASSVSFVSGHAPRGLQLPKTDTVVYYMAGTKIREIAHQLLIDGSNPSTPVLLVHNVSLPDQQEFFYSLQELADKDIEFPTPIITIIGNVVNLRYKQAKELSFCQNVLVTGLDTKVYEHLGHIIHTPLIEIKEIDNNLELYRVIGTLDSFKHLLFTSRNTVFYFFKALLQSGKDSRYLSHLKIYSIGKTTSLELSKYGIIPDLQAQVEDSDGIVAMLKDACIKGRILIPRSDIALGIIPEGLKKLGLDVESVAAYANVVPSNPQLVDLSSVGIIVFSSPSCIDSFISLYGEIPKNKRIVVRGRTTYNYLIRLGYPQEYISIVGAGCSDLQSI